MRTTFRGLKKALSALMLLSASLVLAAPVAAQSSIPQSLIDLQDAFRNVAKRVLPSVVEVLSTSVIHQTAPQFPNFPGFPNFPNTPEFRYFFGPNFQQQGPQPKTTEKVEGLGSGIMIRENGSTVYVLTNNHVVHGAQTIQITLNNGRKFEGKIVGTDPRRDLALVSFDAKSEASKIVLAQLGNSNDVQVGDWVLAIGNPLGLDFTVTHGIVSALGRHGGPNKDSMDTYIQTDAPINRGNSGGALVNLEGQVIGINTWIATPNGASVGLGFAIPINEAKVPIDEFIAHGKVTYGWLGALVSNLGETAARELGLANNKGSFIPSIFEGSPAQKAGILPGDFVTSINGAAIKNTDDLVQTIGDLPVGQQATFKLWRDGKELTKTVTIEARAKESLVDKMRLWPGLDVVNIDDTVRSQLDLKKSVQGVVVAQVEPNSTADVAGLKADDVIDKVNGHLVHNLGEFYRWFNSNPNEVNLSFVRQGVHLSIGMSP
ncbi:MAG: Do family serine endopeptidase [Spirochaetales bacterium]|nr:Do family serine endopeptidase [Spirochaetales bacterium]